MGEVVAFRRLWLLPPVLVAGNLVIHGTERGRVLPIQAWAAIVLLELVLLVGATYGTRRLRGSTSNASVAPSSARWVVMAGVAGVVLSNLLGGFIDGSLLRVILEACGLAAIAFALILRREPDADLPAR